MTTFASELGLLIFSQTFLVGCGYDLMYIPGIVAVADVFEERRSLAL